MTVRYERDENGESRWRFSWDGPAVLMQVRDVLLVVACIKYLFGS